MTRFQFIPQAAPDVLLVVPTEHRDERGFFVETYRASDFEAAGIGPFVQDNFARSRAGVIRGLHYQAPPAPQAKLIRCVRGCIFDVAVDLRRGSPTFGVSVEVTLEAEERRMLYVPAGFAHGYCVPSGEADVSYKVSAEYEPSLSAGVRWDDPDIDVRWPVIRPVLSAADRGLPSLADSDVPFEY